MGIFIYFLIGVMTTIFYGGIIIAVKPKFLPFRFNHKIPTRLKALSIWFGVLFVCLLCLIILLAIHGDFEQVTANSSQTFSAILGCILSTVWWVWAYKKIVNDKSTLVNNYPAKSKEAVSVPSSATEKKEFKQP